MSKQKTKGRFYRGATLSIAEGLSLVEVGEDEKIKKEVDGDLTYVNLLGMQLFKEKGCKCVSCNTTGTFFRKEKTSGPKKMIFSNWHLNLYGVDYMGREVLMTKDHTLAKSKGGEDSLENFETMCQNCNQRKGTKSKEDWESICKNINKQLVGNSEQLVISGAKELWGIDMKPGDYESMLTQIAFSDSKKVLKNKNTYYHVVVVVKGKSKFPVVVVYDSKLKDITSVLGKEVYEKIDQSIPYWAQANIEKYREVAARITAEAEENFKEFESIKDAVKYYKSYKHPELLFRIWKNIPLGNSLNKICKRELGL